MNPQKLVSSTLCLLRLIALLACLHVSVLAQTASFTPRADNPTGHSTITGRAVYDDTGRPARRVPVMLFSKDNQAESRKAVTNADGEFSFKNVSAGDYRVVMGFSGHTNGFSWSNLEKRTGVEVSVDGSSTTNVQVKAERGASITGKVTYPDGEAAVGAQVNVFMKVGKQWTHAPFVASGAETDDRGVFRIYPLQPGEYIVSVMEQSLVIEERDGGTMETVGNKSINPYYFSDASSMKNARVIQVESGRETSNIDLTLAERATYQVAGSVTVSGKPLAGVYLRLDPHDEGLSGPTLTRPYGISTRADKDGRWTFKDVPDGFYDVRIDPITFDGRQMAWNKFLAQRQEVTIAGADVLDVVIALTEGGRISGTIVVEGNKPLPASLNISSERIEPNKSYGYVSSRSVDVDAKGAFLLEGIAPGENTLSVRSEKQYFVKSITWNNRDLLRQTLKVEEGREVKGVVVVLSQEVGRLSGHIVTRQNGKPMSKAFVVLLPLEEAKWSRRDALVGGEADSAGAFSVSGPPGEYLLIVVPADLSRSMKSLDDIRKMAPKATRVTLKTAPQSEVEIVAPPE
ncbi:MAG TPA: carboxypeptidase-like regulatory domain-containing protein [Pyrinomonadaceae bacterium]